MPNFGACRCGTRWRQIGNKTGHCGGCHRTFSSLTTFDAHQTMRHGKNVCTDPAELLTEAGEPRFRTYVDSEGATIWRSADEQPADAWTRHPRNHPRHVPVQPRTGAGGTPEPDGLPDPAEGHVRR
jgi:hypothetical protein